MKRLILAALLLPLGLGAQNASSPYFDPATPGMGILVFETPLELRENIVISQFTIWWFTYDQEGRQRWLVSETTEELDTYFLFYTPSARGLRAEGFSLGDPVAGARVFPDQDEDGTLLFEYRFAGGDCGGFPPLPPECSDTFTFVPLR